MASKFEQLARAASWQPMSADIAELLGFKLMFGVSYFHKNGPRGDLTYSCDKVGDAAWYKLCKEEGLA